MDRVTALSAESLAALRKLAEAAGVCQITDMDPNGATARYIHAVVEAMPALLDELDAREKQIAEWHDEDARFNRGWERRAEPYSALEDEFEQMGYAWANFDKLRAELEAARRERDEAQRKFARTGSIAAERIAALRTELAQAIHDRDKYWKDAEEAEQDKAQMVKEIDEAVEVKVLLAQQCEEAEAKLVTACDDVRLFEARLAAARAEAAELERKGVALCAQNGELLIEMHELRAEAEALRADFFEYAHHLAGLPSCGKNPGAMEMTSRKCDCGLDAARARWEK